MAGSFMPWADSDTSELQTLVADLSPETVIVQRVTRTPDGEGGSSENWTTHATVAGRVHQVKRFATEDEQGGRLQLTQRWEITLPVDTDVLPQDRLVVGGFIYEVVDEPNAVLSFAARVKVSCTRVV